MGSDSSDRSFFDDDDARMNPGSNFVHSPLDKNEGFKVLILHSFKTTKGINVDLLLSSYPLIRTSSTTKLSHMFGKTQISRITWYAETELLSNLETTLIGISASLNIILEGQRHTDQKRLLWIDAICTYSTRSRIDHYRK
jgi:hypothetical protein